MLTILVVLLPWVLLLLLWWWVLLIPAAHRRRLLHHWSLSAHHRRLLHHRWLSTHWHRLSSHWHWLSSHWHWLPSHRHWMTSHWHWMTSHHWWRLRPRISHHPYLPLSLLIGVFRRKGIIVRIIKVRLIVHWCGADIPSRNLVESHLRWRSQLRIRRSHASRHSLQWLSHQ